MPVGAPHPRTIKTVSPPYPSLKRVRNIVLVLSGKGGVGKSSVAVQLALSLAQKHGRRVAVLDVDLTGPSAPRMLGVAKGQVHSASGGWVPPFADAKGHNVAVMSMQYLLPREDDPIVWRGPKKNAMIKQFLSDVVWGELDYLIIDTPPGTSDEHISVVEYLMRPTQTALAADESGKVADLPNPKRTGPVVTSLLVTTPQQVALSDVRKEYNFARTVGLPVLGVVENMSGFVCPCCGDVTALFSSGGGESLANEYNIEFLGSVPVDPTLVQAMETSQPAADDAGDEPRPETFVDRFPKSHLFEVFSSIADKVIAGVGDQGAAGRAVA